MNFGNLSYLKASQHGRDLRREAERGRRADRGDTPVTRVTLRQASSADSAGLRQLAQLESVSPPALPVLIAEVDGRLRAALPLDGSAPLADPFHRGAELIELLRLRASQLAQA